MSDGLKVAAAGVALCWLVAFFLSWDRVAADYDGLDVRNPMRCPRPLSAAFEDETGLCGARSRDRVGFLAVWLVFTGGVSTAFVASCALAGRRTE